VPGRRRLGHATWTVQTSHFAERFQLFVIIALGESIVITGATTAQLELDAARTAAFVLAFVMTAAFWWLYFNYVARVAERRLALAPDRTRVARDAYTYLHAVLVAGIIASAVGDELVIAHPRDELPAEELAVVVGGPALYLLGHALFRLRLAGSVSWKRLAGAVACVAVGGLGAFLPGLAVAALVTAVLIGVIVAERVAALRRRARGEPSPLERLQAQE
jgi:low temperature requirement protein LtrA